MELEGASLFFSLKNIGDEPAVQVVTKIGGKIIGPDRKKKINDLNLFRNLGFIPPGREFRVFVGSASMYFSTKQPTKFTVTITYSDKDKKVYGETITHDLSIFEDLPHELGRN